VRVRVRGRERVRVRERVRDDPIAPQKEAIMSEPTNLVPRPAEDPANGMVQIPPREFTGMATEPFPDKVVAALMRPVNPDDVEIKSDGIVFLPQAWYRTRLFEAFGPGGWAIRETRPSRVMGDLVVFPGALFCLGRFVAEATGECAYRANNPVMTYATCVEGAKSDAIGRCCKDLIPAVQVLWDQQWREAWLAKYATKRWDEKKQRTVWSRSNQKQLVDAIDLAAGAGGQAPSAQQAPAPAPPAESSGPPPVSSAQMDLSSAPSAATGEPPSESPKNDTGEAASEDAYESIRTRMQELKFTRKGAQGFLWQFRVGKVTEMTAVQVDAASALLGAWTDKEMYAKVTAELKAAGTIQ
jgi:hypothetical protein